MYPKEALLHMQLSVTGAAQQVTWAPFCFCIGHSRQGDRQHLLLSLKTFLTMHCMTAGARTNLPQAARSPLHL